MRKGVVAYQEGELLGGSALASLGGHALAEQSGGTSGCEKRTWWGWAGLFPTRKAHTCSLWGRVRMLLTTWH